MYFSFDLK